MNIDFFGGFHSPLPTSNFDIYKICYKIQNISSSHIKLSDFIIKKKKKKIYIIYLLITKILYILKIIYLDINVLILNVIKDIIKIFFIFFFINLKIILNLDVLYIVILLVLNLLKKIIIF